jgi:predicted GNAT superfamily acetyltransferase
VHDDAWKLGHDAARRAGVEIRTLTELHDADAVNHIIRYTWGEHSTLHPELLRAFQAAGDAPIGAVADGRVIGFTLGFLGPEEGTVHLHSHMLAVLPAARRSGVGYALKLAQRAWALDAGISVARWTFDPLQARNARFNLVRLGAVADRFHRHFYGDMQDDLNRGDRSDRLEARWDLTREPGATTTAGRRPRAVLAREPAGVDPRPGTVEHAGDDPAARVEIPDDYAALRDRDPQLAARWRAAVADAIEGCLSAGMVGTGFLPDCAYVFTKPSD